MIQEILRYSEKKIDQTVINFQKRVFFSQLAHSKKICLIIKGLRGVGKTTAICQFLQENIKKGKKVLYYSCDSTFGEELSLFDIVSSFTGYEIFAFDEVHRLKNWDLHIKNVIDNFPKIKLIVSGSSSLKIGSADLSRRHIKLQVKGLSFGEYLSIKYEVRLPEITLKQLLEDFLDIANSLLKETEKSGINILMEFKKYLKTGYFPTVFEFEDEFIYLQTLLSQINQTFTDDILETHPELTGDSILRMRKLLKYIATNAPFTTDLAKMKDLLRIDDNRTIKNYLHYLEQANLLRRISKEGGQIASLKKSEKILLENTNYLYALTSIPAEENTVNLGTIRETFVFNAFKYAATYYLTEQGDFVTGEGQTFEIGGKSKSFRQIAGVKDSYLLCDDLIYGDKNKIPLWLLGFLASSYFIGEE